VGGQPRLLPPRGIHLQPAELVSAVLTAGTLAATDAADDPLAPSGHRWRVDSPTGAAGSETATELPLPKAVFGSFEVHQASEVTVSEEGLFTPDSEYGLFHCCPNFQICGHPALIRTH